MAYARLRSSAAPAPLHEINMVPLIDVMLVLLVLFLVSAPLWTPSVRVQLPRAAATAEREPRPPLVVAIDARGQRHWNGVVVDRERLQALMREAAARAEPPLLAIEADEAVAYRAVAEVMGDASAAGLHRLGFRQRPPSP